MILAIIIIDIYSVKLNSSWNAVLHVYETVVALGLVWS